MSVRIGPTRRWGRNPGTLPLLDPATLFVSAAGFWPDFSLTSGRLFQDSAGATPVTAAGQSVGRASDRSGWNNHALQATSAARPTLQTVSGRNVLRPDGVDDSMLTTLTPGASGNTLIAAVRPNAGVAATAVVIGALSSTSSVLFVGIDSSGRVAGGVGDQLGAVIFGGGDVRNVPCVIALTHDSTTVRLYSWVNGVFSKLYEGARSGTVPTAVQMRFGARASNGSVGAYWPGDIYDALAVQTVLDEATIRAHMRQIAP